MATNKRRNTRHQMLKAAAGGAMPPTPPGQRPPVAKAAPHKPETLTRKFNRASDPRVQIALLRQKLSRPAPTLEFGMKGSVVKGINQKRDRKIMKTIKALSHIVAQSQQRQSQQQKIQMGQRNQIRNTFNRKAGRRM